MAKITEVKPQVKNKSRVNIYLDGEFFCGLDIFLAEKHRLRQGKDIEKEELLLIQSEGEAASFFEKAVSLITMRPRTEKEIRNYLNDKGALEETADEIIKKLYHYSYLDDKAFSEYFINSHKKTWGIKRLKMELKRYGVDSEIIDEALEEMGGQCDEVYALAQKYLRQKRTADYNKLFAYLINKGFDSADIKEALIKIKEDLKEEDNYND